MRLAYYLSALEHNESIGSDTAFSLPAIRLGYKVISEIEVRVGKQLTLTADDVTYLLVRHTVSDGLIFRYADC